MHFLIPILLSLPNLPVEAAPAAAATSLNTFTRTSIISNVQCSTQYTETTAAATPLPTGSTTVHNVTSTITANISTVASTIVVTASPTPYTATETSFSYIASTIDPGTSTSEVFEYVTSTIATFTSTSVECTNGVTPTSTVTTYKGTYTPVSGQPTSTLSEYPVYVNCTTALSTFYTLYATTTSGITTYTYTPASTVSTETITSTRTATTYLPYNTTVTTTSSGTIYSATSTVVTTSISCPSVATSTYALKCAPTNLIGEVNGNGINVISNSPGSANVYTGGAEAGDNPRLCCQLCEESEGCAAMFAQPDAGNCALTFTNETSPSSSTSYGNTTTADGQCGSAFSYGDNGNTGGAGQGFIVQTGCGTISPVAD